MARAVSSQKFSSGFEPSHFRAANFSSMLEQCSSVRWLINITSVVNEPNFSWLERVRAKNFRAVSSRAIFKRSIFRACSSNARASNGSFPSLVRPITSSNHTSTVIVFQFKPLVTVKEENYESNQKTTSSYFHLQNDTVDQSDYYKNVHSKICLVIKRQCQHEEYFSYFKES